MGDTLPDLQRKFAKANAVRFDQVLCQLLLRVTHTLFAQCNGAIPVHLITQAFRRVRRVRRSRNGTRGVDQHSQPIRANTRTHRRFQIPALRTRHPAQVSTIRPRPAAPLRSVAGRSLPPPTPHCCACSTLCSVTRHRLKQRSLVGFERLKFVGARIGCFAKDERAAVRTFEEWRQPITPNIRAESDGRSIKVFERGARHMPCSCRQYPRAWHPKSRECQAAHAQSLRCRTLNPSAPNTS